MRRAGRSTNNKPSQSDGSVDTTTVFTKPLHLHKDEKAKNNLSWRSSCSQALTFLRKDSLQTRRMALGLIVINAVLLGCPSSTDCVNEAISSFRSWRSQRQWVLPSTYIPPSLSDCPKRSDRFPSVKTRVKHYMGRWYEPILQGEPLQSPFGPYWNEKYQAIEGRNKDSPWDPERLAIEPLVNPFEMNPELLFGCILGTYTDKDDAALLQACTNDLSIQGSMRAIMDAALLLRAIKNQSLWMRMITVFYYEGILGWIMEWSMMFRRWRHSDYREMAFLWAIGGGVTKATHQWNVLTPVFGRVRDLLADQDSEYHRHQRLDDIDDCAECGPLHVTILWPLERDEIMKTLVKVPQLDIPFDDKDEVLFWRGHAPNDGSTELTNQRSPEVSDNHQRLVLVELYVDNPMVDAKFFMNDHANIRFPESYYSKPLSMDTILKYKYLLALEGPFSSTDLLWMMFSQSVVFLSTITYTTWAMEDLVLEPYVHYIPVNHNMSNLGDQVEWARRHPDKCRSIAMRSTLYVHDMFFHSQAVRDEEEIMNTIIHRYDQYILKAKPIVVIKFSHVVGTFGTNLKRWYAWFTEDWLRIVFVVALFIFVFRG